MVKSRKVKKTGDDSVDAGGVEDGEVRVKKKLLSQAVRALADIVQKKSANANQLFGETAETMSLYFTLSAIPDKRRVKPVMIPLPHSMYDDKSEICFFCKDPQKQFKELLLEKHPIPGLTKVIGVDKLRRNYKQLHNKRQLADAFDLFLCDVAISEMMPKLLGDVFLDRKKKRPIPVRLRQEDPKTNIMKAISGTPLRIPSGPCLTIKIGRVSDTEDKLIANAATVIGFVKKHMEQQDNPIQSITIKTTDSPALPIWRRPRPEGKFLDLKKYHSDAASSAPSQSGRSGASETAGTSDSELISDAGDTLSTRDTVSEVDTADTLSELGSELDSDAGDVEAEAVSKQDMPLMNGLSKKKRRREGGGSPLVAPKDSPKAAPAAEPKKAKAGDTAKEKAAMPPPSLKKAKKNK